MFYVYILSSKKDESFYIGQTNDLQRRLAFHDEGLSKYTSKKLPWVLVYYEEYKSRTEALKRERFLKQQRNRNFYKSLIQNWPGGSVGYPENSGLSASKQSKSKGAN
ncbi:MAG: GIY-YIG nuclease family protein [Flavobacteriaceae bacterium]|nr:GIY-YIG nuclease family protein [Flavobacteriaceae bacterium]